MMGFGISKDEAIAYCDRAIRQGKLLYARGLFGNGSIVSPVHLKAHVETYETISIQGIGTVSSLRCISKVMAERKAAKFQSGRKLKVTLGWIRKYAK